MSTASLRSFEYLEGLSGSELTKLYQSPSTALAVFRRMLPHLAKSLVLSILYNPDPLPRADLETWTRPEHRRELESSLSLLTRLHIFEQVRKGDDGRRTGGFQLTKGFAESLRQALTGSGGHNSFGVPCDTPAEKRVPVETLDQYAQKKWESMLGYMVASTADMGHRFGDIDQTVAVLLEMGEYVEKRGTKRVVITTSGFELLMQKTNAQVWALLVVYLSTTNETGINPTDALSFFFMLGSLELGQDYSTTNLTASQKSILEDLSALGLIYQTSKGSSKFYPTRLATTLTSDSPALRDASFGTTTGTADDSGGYIIIETNYRVYAYTTSALQISIMRLFMREEARFPNMVCGKITRKTVRRAVDMGITADQIIDFLSAHAHPQMRRAAGASASSTATATTLPSTVMDQIRLWQLENERMVTTPGYLFKEFNTEDDYVRLAKYADEIGVLKWKNDKRRMFFVTRHEQIVTYYRNNMSKKRSA